MLLIFDPSGSSAPTADVPAHGANGPGHIAFAVSGEKMADWQQRLADHGIKIEKVVDWPKGGQSLYFRDPAGNSLELTSPEIWGLVG